MKDSLGVTGLMDFAQSGSSKVHGWFHFGDNLFPS
jgi:hypothetical protein